MRDKSDRQKAQAKGRQAEELAAEYLQDRGYTIEGFNQRTPGGELDLIAWDGDTLVFVEVRARGKSPYGLPEETVDARKQARLVSAAEAYLAGLQGPMPVCRFDVVAVALAEEPPTLKHLPDAFRVGD